MDKTYRPFEFIGGGSERFMTIVNGENDEPWQGFWRATGEPIELPNVLSVVWDQAMKEKGARSATIEIENIVFKAIAGPGGVFHQVSRGYLSPTLGARLLTRLAQIDEAQNEWYEILNNGYKIDVYEGYGDQTTRTYSGLIDTTQLETHPDRITINSRSFWMVFTDQRVMGSNKAPEIISPLIVADRESTLGIKPVGSTPVASSTAAGRSVHDIVAKDNSKSWLSKGRSDGTGTEWVEIDLPPGYYENFYLRLPFAGQSIHVGVFAGAGSDWNGTLVGVDEWVDAGKGSFGGVPFTNYWGASNATGEKRSLGAPFQAAKGSKLRVTFSKLPYRPESHDYRAGCTRLAAFLFGTDSKHPLNGHAGVNANHWVLIDDLADIAKLVFMWGGYHEWEVEDVGLSLYFPMSWQQDKFLIDMIDDALAQCNWVCYEKSPSASSESLGVPVFEHNRAMDKPASKGMLQITDDDMIETINPTFDLSNLPYVIRARGAVDTKNGNEYGEELIRRYMATYFPPWSGAGPHITEAGRVAGIRRHDLSVNEKLFSDTECEFYALLIAEQYALEAYKAQLQIAGYPGIEMNQQVSIVSDTTGINSRLLVDSIHSEHTTGPKGSWKMTVAGSLLDNIDMQQIRADLFEREAEVQAEKRLKEPV
jgi:hypothetical protein